MKKFLLFTTLVFCIISVSCKKSSSSKSKTELLTQKPWIQVNSEVNMGSGYTVDPSFAGMPSCEKDNQLIFKTDGTAEANEGSTKCDPTDPQIIEINTWSFVDNETKIQAGTLLSNIEELSETTLKSTYTVTIGTTTYTNRTTLSHP